MYVCPLACLFDAVVVVSCLVVCSFVVLYFLYLSVSLSVWKIRGIYTVTTCKCRPSQGP